MALDFKEEIKISRTNETNGAVEFYYVDLVTALRIFIMQENAISHPIEGAYHASLLEFNARTTDEADRALLGMKDEECWVRQFALRRESSTDKPNKYGNKWNVYLKTEHLISMYEILDQWNKYNELQRTRAITQPQ